MKSKKFNVLVWAVVAFTTTGVAQSNLTLKLKNGSEMTGFISEQRPGDNIRFEASKAIIVIENDQSVTDNNYRIGALSPEWIAWGEEHDAFSGMGDSRSMVLSDIVTKDTIIKQVRILERGAKVRYLDLSTRSHTLSWDAIQEISVEKRPKLQLSGINRRYRVVSGMEYDGQYVGEIPGETMSLYRDNGVVEIVKTYDVVKDVRYKVNPNQGLIEQSDLLDVVILEKGGSYTGVIYERNYLTANQGGEDYLLMELEGNHETIRLNLSDIQEYRKRRNPNYVQLMDTILQPGEFCVNRVVIKPQQVTKFEGDIVIDTDSLVVIQDMKESIKIAIETNFADPSYAQQYKMVRARRAQRDDRKKEIIMGFTIEDVLMSPILVKSVETSVNHTTKMEYVLPARGVYVLYNPSTKQAYPFRVK